MTDPHDARVSRMRRNLLTAGLGACAFSLMRPAAFAADGFDPSDPVSVLHAVSRMRGSTDGRIAMGWLKAARFGVVDSVLTPLFGLVTGTFTRKRFLDDGSVLSTSFELAYYTDLESGELLDTFTMPYTGKTVEVPRLLLGPNSGITRPVFHEVTEFGDPEERTDSDVAMRPAGSSRVERWLGPVNIAEGKVHITEASSAVRIPADPDARKIVYSEAVTSSALYDDVINPDLPTTPSQLSYTGVSSWRPWMQMGDHPGHTTAHGIGGKVFDVEDLPEDYRAISERFYPEAIGDPGAILDRVAA